MELIINTVRDSYGKEDLNTMTVGELMDFLSDYDEDTKVILSFDKGYTYGAINEYRFEESEEE